MREYRPYQPHRKIGRPLFLTLLFGIVLAAVITGTQITDESGADDTIDKATKMPKSTWRYSRDRDELRNRSIHFATITSDSSTVFDVPQTSHTVVRWNGLHRRTYQVRDGDGGVAKLDLALRNDHDGDTIYFVISNGRFECPPDGCAGAINVDGTQMRVHR